MRGEIAVGSYSPLPAYTQQNRISTSPGPVRHSQGAMIQTDEIVTPRSQGDIVQRRKVESERPIPNDTEKLAVELATLATSGPFGEKRGEERGTEKENSVDREEREEDKNITNREVEAEGGALDEMGGVLQVPICRTENSKLRELHVCMYALYMT